MKNNKLIWFLSTGIILLLVVSLQAQANANLVIHLPLLLKNAPIRQSGQVVFFSTRTGSAELFRMDYDGSNPVQLTDNQYLEIEPDWSPDGSKIAYVSDQSGQSEIHVMDSDGTNQVQLTHQGDCQMPQWSPDGSQIAFSGREDANLVIYTMTAAGEDVTVVTPPEVSAYMPSWSPDGTRIAYLSASADPVGVYAVDLDGNPPQLLFGNVLPRSMAWSPDGRWLALSLMIYPPCSTADIYLLDLISHALPRLTYCDRDYLDLDWFPGGNFLIFHADSNSSTGLDIYTMTWTGEMLQNITDAVGTDAMADWTP